MRPAFVVAVGVFLGLAFAPAARAEPEPGLAAFASAAELNAFLDARAPQDAREPVECTPDKICPDDGALEEIVVTGSRIASTPSITNNQMAGVDEGDIVKARGDTLIILRRGRLFTVSTAGGRLRPVDRIDAFPPGVDASDDWYDEMLVTGDWVIVVGFSYERGGTEINRFHLDAAGRLRFVDSHRLSSDDYYSERNYAARLVGERLVFYMPVELDGDDPLERMPTLRRWRADDAETGDEDADEVRIVHAEDVYRAPGLDGEGAPRPEAIHVTVGCELTAPELACRATAIIGPTSRNFYVTPSAVYVWMSRETWDGQDKLKDSQSWLYRTPLDGGRPQAAAVLGTPIDQYSFREDPEAGRIDVLIFAWGPGDAMFGADYPTGQAALLKLPFARFGDGATPPNLDDYRALPILPKEYRQVRNRFVGDELLYSVVLDRWRMAELDEVTPRRESLLTVVPLDDRPIRRFTLPGSVSRIEEMGLDAVVVASDEDAVFTTVALTGARPTISDQFVLRGSEEAEDRSHAFFYRPDPNSPDGATGLLGLPVITRDEDDDSERASVAYLRRGSGRLRSAGTLDARPLTERVDDGCVASCHDWYGDARPIFFRDRIFGLLGYEIVEGVERSGGVREIRRIDLTPPPPEGPRPYYRY